MVPVELSGMKVDQHCSMAICSNGTRRLIGMAKPLHFSREMVFIQLDERKHSGVAFAIWSAQLDISVQIESLNCSFEQL